MRKPIGAGLPVVVKVGSSSIAGNGGVDSEAIARIVDQVDASWMSGHPTVLVSSGAVACGLSAIGLDQRPADVVSLQVAAAVGQVRLMERYTAEFAARGRTVGQVLLTKVAFNDREQYLHSRRAIRGMIEVGIVPIVNENDTVAIEELRLGDNDRLAAMVSHLVSAGLLILLTDTEGLLTSDPRLDEDAELVSAVRHTDELLDRLAIDRRGPMGSGGIATKIAAARMAAWSGIPTVIGSSSDPSLVLSAINGSEVGTWVAPRERRLSARKLWIAFGQRAKASVTIDPGAVRALVESGRSLLPVGVTSVNGAFEVGSTIEIRNPEGDVIAKGITRLGSDEAEVLKGKRSNGLELVHRDDLVVMVDQS